MSIDRFKLIRETLTIFDGCSLDDPSDIERVAIGIEAALLVKDASEGTCGFCGRKNGEEHNPACMVRMKGGE